MSLYGTMTRTMGPQTDVEAEREALALRAAQERARLEAEAAQRVQAMEEAAQRAQQNVTQMIQAPLNYSMSPLLAIPTLLGSLATELTGDPGFRERGAEQAQIPRAEALRKRQLLLQQAQGQAERLAQQAGEAGNMERQFTLTNRALAISKQLEEGQRQLDAVEKRRQSDEDRERDQAFALHLDSIRGAREERMASADRSARLRTSGIEAGLGPAERLALDAAQKRHDTVLQGAGRALEELQQQVPLNDDQRREVANQIARVRASMAQADREFYAEVSRLTGKDVTPGDGQPPPPAVPPSPVDAAVPLAPGLAEPAPARIRGNAKGVDWSRFRLGPQPAAAEQTTTRMSRRKAEESQLANKLVELRPGLDIIAWRRLFNVDPVVTAVVDSAGLSRGRVLSEIQKELRRAP